MPDEAVRVVWEVADDEHSRASSPRASAEASPLRAHAVHVEVDGLRPARRYWYRFRAGTWESPVGRTRTAPEPARRRRPRCGSPSRPASTGSTGYFTAHRHLAAGRPRRRALPRRLHLRGTRPSTTRCAPAIGAEANTLDDYRQRYAQYKTDPDLQAAHAAFPFIVTWDDHEVENNYANDVSQEGDGRASRSCAAAPPPTRPTTSTCRCARVRRPRGPDMPLYRRFAYGRLVDLSVLDTRQYRTDQPCGDGQSALCDGARDRRRDDPRRAPARMAVRAPRRVAGALARAGAAGDDGARSISSPGRRRSSRWTSGPPTRPTRRRLLEFFGTGKGPTRSSCPATSTRNWVCDLHARRRRSDVADRRRPNSSARRSPPAATASRSRRATRPSCPRTRT